MADPNTPTWLSEDAGGASPAANGDSGAAAAAAPVAVVDSGSNGNSAAVGASTKSLGAGGEEDLTADDPGLPGVILTMRLANMGASTSLIICAILELISIPKISGIVLSIYACCGGILICCLETQLKFLRVMIAVNFGFLFHSVWRFLFYLLLGSVAWTFDGLFGKVVGCVFFGVALFNTYVLCRYPSYRRMREKIALEEDKRIEAKISKEAKKQVIQQMVS
mmetsp:Transcript_1488/g.2066  ORF Transcript_1488/g.2066 Transcript_1488/m.2066 type:complete len:222 (-) Transcript_1488:118-783(-)|eukprot:CAMPEP_0198136860 /NCGR_PEP_ID=MMETSP1443-20131203/428_1 /TAXON_ID=186043 /ORGANISM="Entomoneis sp., Strain CCMP2396" /LENGTH=221 /DNA_ID=CAMNT_0043798141 /DNA_START=67 /DNA_END=732 /DNA_ORIENTATION=+